MMILLTASLKNWIMKLSDARLDWSDRQIDFDTPAVV